MDFLYAYFLCGVFLFLLDSLKGMKQGVPFEEQMRIDLSLWNNDLRGLFMAIAVYILSWPMILILSSGGPPTRGA